MVDAIEKKLGENQWLAGQAPGDADRESFDAQNGKVPNVAKHPNAFAWYCLVSKFAPSVRETWKGGAGAAGGKAAAGGKKEQPAAKEETKQEAKGGKKKGKKGKNAPKEEEKKEDEIQNDQMDDKLDDMVDLFGSDDEEDLVSKFLCALNTPID